MSSSLIFTLPDYTSSQKRRGATTWGISAYTRSAYLQKHKAVKCDGPPLSFATGGQKARVVFAELACREPDVLILVSEVDCGGG